MYSITLLQVALLLEINLMITVINASAAVNYSHQFNETTETLNKMKRSYRPMSILVRREQEKYTKTSSGCGGFKIQGFLFRRFLL